MAIMGRHINFVLDPDRNKKRLENSQLLRKTVKPRSYKFS